MNSPEVPERVSHYRILNKLGAGGMAEVYLAEDTSLHRKVAIKFLPEESTSDEQAKKRLVREAQAAATLDHPNICSIHEVSEEAGRSFIVMQYVEGETLASRMRNKPLALTECLEISTQVADALAEAHAHGIIHRDIKPQNIMLTARHYAKVMDFGLAEFVRDRSLVDSKVVTESLLTEPGAIVGTVPYMSPEQVRGESLDARSDIFSFGSVLYEMVTGRPPFAAESAASTISAILTHEPEPLARYSRGVPPELERIVSKVLRKDREERYQTVKDLVIDLKNLRDKLVFEAKLERTASPESANWSGVQSASGTTVATASQSAAQTDNLAAAKTETNAEYIVGQITSHKLTAAMVMVALMAVAAVSYYFSASNSEAAIDSIAVLPFVSESGDPDVEYMSDGMSDSLINSLSQLPNLLVKARSSVFRYKGKEVESQQAASELSVQAILTGRFLLRGDDLSLYLSLVDGRTGNQIWGEQYNRKLKDLVPLQSEIARDAANKLRARLSGADEQKLAKSYTANVEAYQLYLKGRYYLNKRTKDGIRRGIEYFNQAIDIDPAYAMAYAGLADCYGQLANYYVLPPEEAFSKATAATLKALEIDDALAEAHTSLAFAKTFYEWDWLNAEREYKRAIELNPNFAAVHYFYSIYLAAMGRFEEAINEAKRAQEIDSLSALMTSNVGWILYFARKYDEAIEQYRKAIAIDPNFFRSHRLLGTAFLQKKQPEQAIAEIRQAVNLSAKGVEEIAHLGHAYAVSGKKAEAKRIRDELKELSEQEYVSPYLIGLIYVGLGEKEQAFEWLRKSSEARSANLIYLNIEPIFDGLRFDPEFAKILQRVGLAP